jgi:uncharacterized OB-fold protein
MGHHPVHPTVGAVTTPATRLLPPVDDDNREFWTSGASGRLRLPWCAACDRWVFPPTRTCPGCGGGADYRAVSGKGRVFTFTVNHQPYNPEVPVPYVIAIVELAEQERLRFTTNVVGCPPNEVEIGMPVRVTFEQQGDVFVPIFEPDPDAAQPPRR